MGIHTHTTYTDTQTHNKATQICLQRPAEPLPRSLSWVDLFEVLLGFQALLLLKSQNVLTATTVSVPPLRKLFVCFLILSFQAMRRHWHPSHFQRGWRAINLPKVAFTSSCQTKQNSNQSDGPRTCSLKRRQAPLGSHS